MGQAPCPIPYFFYLFGVDEDHKLGTGFKWLYFRAETVLFGPHASWANFPEFASILVSVPSLPGGFLIQCSVQSVYTIYPSFFSFQ
jgi:hypothetical protein